MRLLKRIRLSCFTFSAGKKGQGEFGINKVLGMILAIIFLVVAVIFLWNVRGYLANYLAKLYDCLRFGGCFG